MPWPKVQKQEPARRCTDPRYKKININKELAACGIIMTEIVIPAGMSYIRYFSCRSKKNRVLGFSSFVFYNQTRLHETLYLGSQRKIATLSCAHLPTTDTKRWSWPLRSGSDLLWNASTSNLVMSRKSPFSSATVGLSAESVAICCVFKKGLGCLEMHQERVAPKSSNLLCRPCCLT